MPEVKITYNELINKGAKQTSPEKIVIVKSILTNLRSYILAAVNS
jgi:hypothetical protein